MAKAIPAAAMYGGKTNVRVVVCGDRGTGKSSLIVTAAAETFPANVPPLLPPTTLPLDYYQDCVPITIIDTSSSEEASGQLAVELKKADAIVLTYGCDDVTTLTNLSEFWLPKFRELEVKVPVIVVGCKLDLRPENQELTLEQVMMPIMQQFREIETCIECSAIKHIQIPEVFYYAQKAVLHPTGPLFDQESQTLKPRCVRALKRIFILCDHDRDGALNNDELNDFQVKCFNAPLQPSEIVGVKRVVQDKLEEGVNESGLTLTGFLFLHALFIEKGRLETTWTVLRKFGYNNEIKLSSELIPSSFKRTPDQTVELTNEAIEFLKGIYELFDGDGDNNLRLQEVEDLFSTAPENPWIEAPYCEAAAKTALEGLSLDGFLSLWALMTLLDPARSVENLIYIGYSADPSTAVRITRQRRLDRKKQQTDRNVFQCFVFGPNNAGKSTLLNSYVGRQFSDNYNPTTEDRYAVNAVDLPGGIKKTLVLREIPADRVTQMLSNKESLAACDIAVFVHDSSSEFSWKKATELLVDVASHGEDTGYEVPCLIVAAKDDLDSFPMIIQDSTRVTQDMGIDAPIPISSKLGDFSNVFRRIISAAEHPHLSIPETEVGKSRKQYHRLVNRSLMVVSVGAAVAIVGLAAYRVYAARKSASGMVGLSIAEALKKTTTLNGPWKVYGSVRRPKPSWFPPVTLDRYITLKLFRIADEVTHVFWVALQTRESEEGNMKVNLSMTINMINTLRSGPASKLTHISLPTGAKQYLGPTLDPGYALRRKMVAVVGDAPLLINPLLIRETVNKVDKCMARLQELQYCVTGGSKVVSGVSLSPRSTRVYLKTSLRCKQESIRINNFGSSKSPTGKKFPQSKGGDWKRMSLPAMLVGETVSEILQATKFAREIVDVVSNKSNKVIPEDPKTPISQHKLKPKTQVADTTETLSRRKNEKQQRKQNESSPSPRLGRARSRIQFKVSPPPSSRKEFVNEKENTHYLANRISPRNRPWVKKTVLFPNPLFLSSPSQKQQNFCRTRSPVIARNKQTPHKFLIKSPVKIKSPVISSISPPRLANPNKQSPKLSRMRKTFSPSRLANKLPSPSKLRRSFSPSRLAKRLVSPMKSRNSNAQKNVELISGLRQRPFSIPKFSSGRI
ncbi:hypothetical protein ACFE04_027417 [Oxalis oulophora]